MNKNNLEDLRAEMRALKIPEGYIKQMEEQVEKGLPEFKLKGQLPSDSGTLNMALNFRRSGQSEYYYLNRYDLTLSKAKPLEAGKQYIVLSTEADGKNHQKKFDNPVEALALFHKLEHKGELAIIGVDANDKVTMATVEKGKVDFVAKEHRSAFYAEPLTHSFYLERGAGYNIRQGANMLQGRSAYRDDLVSRAGKSYEAWSLLQIGEPKDRYGNYQVRQLSENYGYNLNAALDEYKLKLPEEAKKKEELLTDLKDGSRVIVPVEQADGKELRMQIEAVPRYGNINFYQLNGKPEKREQYLKPEFKEQGNDKNKAKAKDKSQAQEMSV